MKNRIALNTKNMKKMNTLTKNHTVTPTGVIENISGATIPVSVSRQDLVIIITLTLSGTIGIAARRALIGPGTIRGLDTILTTITILGVIGTTGIITATTTIMEATNTGM